MEGEHCGRGSTSQRNTGPRRVWTPEEEQSLVNGMKELFTKGWRCDNEFRTCYLGALATHMADAFPGKDLKATPHIHSKIHMWKK